MVTADQQKLYGLIEYTVLGRNKGTHYKQISKTYEILHAHEILNSAKSIYDEVVISIRKIEEVKHVAYINYPEYDPPLKKMIASGSKGYCEKALIKYISKNEGKWGGVEQVDKPGDPYYSQWPAV